MFSEEPKLNHSDTTEEKSPSGESEVSPQQTATAPTREPVSVADPTEDDDDRRPAGDVDFGQLLDQFEQEQATLQEGEVVRGTVVGISERGVVIDFGYKSEGIVNPAEFTEDGVITVRRVTSRVLYRRKLPMPARFNPRGRVRMKAWDDLRRPTKKA